MGGEFVEGSVRRFDTGNSDALRLVTVAIGSMSGRLTNPEVVAAFEDVADREATTISLAFMAATVVSFYADVVDAAPDRAWRAIAPVFSRSALQSIDEFRKRYEQ